MQNLNKVIYALGLSTLLYLAEEIGRKKGIREERAKIRKIIEDELPKGLGPAFSKIQKEVD